MKIILEKICNIVFLMFALLQGLNKAVSLPLVCQAFGISQTCYRYQAKLCSDNSHIADWLVRLTHSERNWGFGLCYMSLRNLIDQR